MQFIRLNPGWNAEPNYPRPQIETLGKDLVLSFYMDPFLYEVFSKGDRGTITFHECCKYRYGEPDDEGFFIKNKSRFKEHGVKWGEFYLIEGSDWEHDFPNDGVSLFKCDDPAQMSHYLFYFKNGTFECIAKKYDIKVE